MNNFTSLEKVDNLSIYGHSFVESEIVTQYPYDEKVFNKKDYGGMTITYNPLIAMQFKLDNMKCLVWGQKVNNSKHAFVFDCKSKQQVFSF